jgi:hypothetical protein
VNKLWTPSLSGYCFDAGIFFLVTAVVDLLVDVCLLCLPLWVISHLQLQHKQQITLAMVFLLGGL